ncbi:MAG: hypothetical protein AB1486_17255 [Planctomycetota bacterium]
MSARSSPLLVMAVAAFLVTGCAGARTKVTFDMAEYPISMTSSVPDRDGQLLEPSEMEFVGRLHAEGEGWSTGWSLIPLSHPDFSEEVNKQVADAGGEAVVNLRVNATDSTINLIGIAFLHWIPVFPGAVAVSLDGDIVRSQRSLSRADEPATEEFLGPLPPAEPVNLPKSEAMAAVAGQDQG